MGIFARVKKDREREKAKQWLREAKAKEEAWLEDQMRVKPTIAAAETKPFKAWEYKHHDHRHTFERRLELAGHTPEEIADLCATTTPESFEQTAGRVRYLLSERVKEQAAAKEAEEAEKAKFMWATVLTYDGAEYEGRAEIVERTLYHIHREHRDPDTAFLPVKTWKNGTHMLRLNDIKKVIFPEGFLERPPTEGDAPNEG